MKFAIPLALLMGLAIKAQSQCTTNVSLRYNQFSLTVDTNQTAKIVTWVGTSPASLRISFPTGGYVDLTNSVYNNANNLPVVIAGPASIYITPALPSCFATIELNTPCPSLVPSTAVVIPADSAGPVNIILESSVDLITWTAALPGTYGTSTTNRFFRVRAQR